VIQAEAQQLLAAYSSREPVAPLTERHPEITLDDAYSIQLEQIERRLAGGAVIKGHKVGLTSRAMQTMLGVDQPDYGHLLDDMFYAESVPIPVSRFLQPRIEPEIAFVLGAPLAGPNLTVADVLRAVDFVVPALEIIDSRIRDWQIKLFDTIADNASSAGVVLGAQPTRLGSDTPDLSVAGCNLWRNGEIVQTGAGGAVLGHPLLALVWLANTLGERGVSLEEGSVVLPGSCTAAVPVAAADVFTADFGPLGVARAAFGEEEGS
jgi:2-keto-4-pentenoate hydratase